MSKRLAHEKTLKNPSEDGDAPPPQSSLRSTPSRRLVEKLRNESALSSFLAQSTTAIAADAMNIDARWGRGDGNDGSADAPNHDNIASIRTSSPIDTGIRPDDVITKSAGNASTIDHGRSLSIPEEVSSLASTAAVAAHASVNDVDLNNDATNVDTRPIVCERRCPVVEWVDGPGLGSSGNIDLPSEEAHTEEELNLEVVIQIVDDAIIEEEVEYRLHNMLGEAAKATPVQHVRGYRSKKYFLAVGMCVIIAIVISLRIALSSKAGQAVSNEPLILEASVVYENFGSAVFHPKGHHGIYSGLPVWANATRYRTRDGTKIISGGIFGEILCTAVPCHEDSSLCSLEPKIYEPGCCLGPECEPDTKCGKDCPPFGESCHLTNFSAGCRSADCYTCDKNSEDEDMWVVYESLTKVDCLATGTAWNGDKEYKWAILCGTEIDASNKSISSVPSERERKCIAFRKGGGLLSENVGLESSVLSCPYVQVGECGCGPTDKSFWDLPIPSTTCVIGTCPIQCKDGEESDESSQLCYSFGGIEWWEGENWMSSTTFEPKDNPEIFDIVIV